MAVYIGVDQALRKIGVCVIEDNVPVIRERLAPPGDLRGPERLQLLRTLLVNTLHPYRQRVTAAAMEAQSLGSLGDIDQLGQINGVVQVLLMDLGAVPHLVAPALLKKFVTGHSGASKSDMMRASAARWGYDFVQDDICDAHGLARMAQECHEKQSQVRHEVEAIASLLRKRTHRKPIKRLFAKTL